MHKIIAALALFVAASAAAAPFQNGSFENHAGGERKGFGDVMLSNGDGSITGWVVTGSNIDYLGSYWVAADGTFSLDLNGVDQGGIAQTFDTVPGQPYLVTFVLAGNPDAGGPVKSIQVQASGGSASTYSFDTTGHSVTSMGWTGQTYTFTATSTSTTLGFSSLETGAGGPALDNVVVAPLVPTGGNVYTVPTLSTWAGLLLLAGLLGTALWWQRGRETTHSDASDPRD